MGRSAKACTALSCFCFTLVLATAQQVVPTDAGCVQQKDGYRCNWASFKGIFDRAHKVAIAESSRDRTTSAQLRTMLRELGKAEPNTGEPGSLVVELRPAEVTGVDLGLADHDVATLRVYAVQSPSGQRSLLWSEILRGQDDRPWPAQVHALIDQFQNRFTAR